MPIMVHPIPQFFLRIARPGSAQIGPALNSSSAGRRFDPYTARHISQYTCRLPAVDGSALWPIEKGPREASNRPQLLALRDGGLLFRQVFYRC